MKGVKAVVGGVAAGAERVFVAGHRGMVGSALVRALGGRDDVCLITRERSELDLTDALQVRLFFEKVRPTQVYLAAARVGGIHANNTYPAQFIRENLQIQCNVIHEAWRSGVDRLLFLGSSCIYPREAPQPMAEEALLQGLLEPTNEPYAIAKIAGIKMCESYNRQYGTDFRSVMPTNLFGPGDNYHPQNSHVIPGMIHRLHEARRQGLPAVKLWGTGTPKREFLYVDDLAEACLHVMTLSRKACGAEVEPMRSHLNVGTGTDVTIQDLAKRVASVIGYDGRLEFDATMPDGTPRKLLDVTRLSLLGWRARTTLYDGLRLAYADYLERHAHADVAHAAD